MRKGCIISVIFVSFLIMLGAGVTRFYMLPRIEKSGNQGITEKMCELLAHYYRENGKWPQGANEDIAIEVGGLNQFGKNYIYLNQVKIPKDQFLDAYNNPLRITLLLDGDMQVISAGGDAEFGTADDAMARVKPPPYDPPKAPEIKPLPKDSSPTTEKQPSGDPTPSPN